MLRRLFFRDEKANIGILFGILSMPAVALTGGAVDYAMVAKERTKAQNALDSAALVAGREIGLQSTAALKTLARTHFEGAYTPPSGTTYVLEDPVIGVGELSLAVKLTTETAFMKLAGVSTVAQTLKSEVKMSQDDFDVVMVLDNSGSMSGSKISTLKTAAKDLTKILLDINVNGGKSSRVQVGLVPFAVSVNVGAGNGPTYSGTTRTSNGAAWLDTGAVSPLHRVNFAGGSTDNRFDLFAALAAARPSSASALTWAGCVETRPYPLDVQDTTPSAAVPASYFVPMFAPDEPGYRNSSGSWVNPSGFDNNYLDDNGGQCTANTANTSTTAGQQEAQSRTCKYKNPTSVQWRNTSSLGGSFGPNDGCTSRPILPMTRTRSTVEAAIDAMQANGNTNIHEGVMWGWRTLSPKAPFTEGREPTADQPLRRVMIVMTDGANFINPMSNFNRSVYTAYNYIAQNKLGTTSNIQSQVQDKQDQRTLEACTNAKTDGQVTIYTIAFQVSDTDTLNMLRDCATGTSYSYRAENNSELLAAFNRIANEISKLRIAK